MNQDLSFPNTPRLRREAVTMEAMLFRHCRTRHGGGVELCSDCRELLAFSLLQIGMPSLSVVLKCAIVATTASTSHFLIFQATAHASAGRIAPMTYVQLLVAIVGACILIFAYRAIKGRA